MFFTTAGVNSCNDDFTKDSEKAENIYCLFVLRSTTDTKICKELRVIAGEKFNHATVMMHLVYKIISPSPIRWCKHCGKSISRPKGRIKYLGIWLLQSSNRESSEANAAALPLVRNSWLSISSSLTQILVFILPNYYFLVDCLAAVPVL